MNSNIQNINKVLTEFGSLLAEFIVSVINDKISSLSEDHNYSKLRKVIRDSAIENPWFTEEFQLKNLEAWSQVLQKDKIETWLQDYPELDVRNKVPKKIGLVMAANIPLVGLHDILCILVSGNIAISRMSNRDRIVYPVLRDILIEIDRSVEERWILIEDEHLKNIDAVIATGSDNSSRYFEYYFGKYPNIIRKNRNSVAILDGSESDEELKALADDIFLYFGLGCRNVSKLYVREDFRPDDFYRNIEHYSYLNDHNKYANNYDYQKAILMVNKIPIYDNGFLVLKEDSDYSSPVSTLNYEKFSSLEDLNTRLNEDREKLQCIVSKDKRFKGRVSFGQTQFPQLKEYADNIDTLKFLLNLSKKRS